jgi:hypothetical protein
MCERDRRVSVCEAEMCMRMGSNDERVAAAVNYKDTGTENELPAP